MADQEGGVFLLSKKAFVSTLVALAFNPIGVAVGYGVGKWLQAPKLSVQTVNVEAEAEGITLPKELLPTLASLQRYQVIQDNWRLRQEERDNLKQGILSAAAARGVIGDTQAYKESLISLKQDLGNNIDATMQWVRGQELIVRPIFFATGSLTGENPQTIVNRNKNELLGIYRSALRDIESRLEDVNHLIEFLQAHPNSDKRTGDTTIRVGILNAGDSEGVVFPKAELRSSAGEIDLTSTGSGFPIVGSGSGGYVVVPARSFREIVYQMDHSTRGDAAENWKKLVRSGGAGDVTVELRTSGKNLSGEGKLPL